MLGWTFIHRNSNADPSSQAKNTRNTGTIFPILRFQMHFFYSSCLTEEGQGSFAWIINNQNSIFSPLFAAFCKSMCFCTHAIAIHQS